MIRAMIFDLDGTLVQTEKLKALSYAKAAAKLRPELAENDVIDAYKAVVGLPRSEVARRLMQRFGLEKAAAARMPDHGVDTAWQAFIQERLQVYEPMMRDPEILKHHRWPHTMALLQRGRKSCQKVGLATMSYCAQVRRVLEILNLKDAFDFVASRDDVESGKPDPEIYLLVSEQLRVPPTECLVIEDSPAGVEAALAAGMPCVAVTTPFTRHGLYSGNLIDSRWIVDDPDRLDEVVARRLNGGCNALR